MRKILRWITDPLFWDVISAQHDEMELNHLYEKYGEWYSRTTVGRPVLLVPIIIFLFLLTKKKGVIRMKEYIIKALSLMAFADMLMHGVYVNAEMDWIWFQKNESCRLSAWLLIIYTYFLFTDSIQLSNFFMHSNRPLTVTECWFSFFFLAY